MSEFKYNYIIAGGSGFYLSAYRDLFELDNVSYHRGYANQTHTKFVNYLLRLDFNLTLNKYMKTPLRWITYPLMYPHEFKNHKPECYIFFENQFAVINTGYLEYLRKTKPGVKLVLYMQDIVQSLPYYDIADYKKRFDLVLSYDKGDCEKYGLVYYPTPYSCIQDSSLGNSKDIDVFFCGAAKNRYETILNIYNECTKKGLKCLFYITGISDDKVIKRDGIVYNTPISYEENVTFVKRSKCILEIMQKNADGYTPRLWEALFYGDHLLTNNQSIRQSEYFKPQSIHFLPEVENIREWIDSYVDVDAKLIQSKSPISMLKEIDRAL